MSSMIIYCNDIVKINDNSVNWVNTDLIMFRQTGPLPALPVSYILSYIFTGNAGSGPVCLNMIRLVFTQFIQVYVH